MKRRECFGIVAGLLLLKVGKNKPEMTGVYDMKNNEMRFYLNRISPEFEYPDLQSALDAAKPARNDYIILI
jgi:hypothetical protein